MSYERADLVRAVWLSGSCGYLLHEGQLEVRKLFAESQERRFVLCCSRRYGKSFLACVIAIEHALQSPEQGREHSHRSAHGQDGQKHHRAAHAKHSGRLS